MKRGLCALYFSMAAMVSHHAFADGAVVATIKPLHSLVAAIMEGDKNQPLLLVDGKASLHSFSLKPSQVSELQKAKVVFYISDDFEMFMQKTLQSLPKDVQRAPLGKLQGIGILPVRRNAADAHGEHAHEHEEDDHDHHHGAHDLHLWMSPLNAKIMAMEIARQLAIAFPDKKEIYFANLKKVGLRLDGVDKSMQERMGKLYGRSFVAFHDATQYFDGIYGLRFAGAITLNPERGISAKRVSELRETITKANVSCVFREPQFDAKVVDNLLEGTKAKSAVIDAEGALLAPGPELYFQLIDGVATSFESCLAP